MSKEELEFKMMEYPYRTEVYHRVASSRTKAMECCLDIGFPGVDFRAEEETFDECYEKFLEWNKAAVDQMKRLLRNQP